MISFCTFLKNSQFYNFKNLQLFNNKKSTQFKKFKGLGCKGDVRINLCKIKFYCVNQIQGRSVCLVFVNILHHFFFIFDQTNGKAMFSIRILCFCKEWMAYRKCNPSIVVNRSMLDRMQNASVVWLAAQDVVL